MSAPAEILLDRATAAKEVSILTALVLVRAGGNIEKALELLEEIASQDSATPQGDELDSAAIAAQAIREARDMGVKPEEVT